MALDPLESELSLATQLARDAGAAILEVRARARASSRVKADASRVTEADLAADAIIRAGLAHRAEAVITEETWHDAAIIGPHARAWFVDPIDGTEDFIAGRPDYVVQIGLCVDGMPALGVVHQPATGITWRSVVDAQRCERVAADGSVTLLSVRDSPLAVPRIAVSVSHPSAAVNFILGELGGVPVPRGSVGLKVAMILEGEADAYLTASRRLKVWDTCAPAALLLGAGGVVTSLSGQALSFSDLAAHDDGACMWTPAARDGLRTRVAAAVAAYGARHRV